MPTIELRWNSSCFGRLTAHLGTISPQLICQLPHFSMEKRGLLPLFPRETLGRPNLYRLKDCPKLPAGKERPQVPHLRAAKVSLLTSRLRTSPMTIRGRDFYPVWRSTDLEARVASSQTWDNSVTGITDKGCAYERPRCQTLSAAPPICAIRFRLRACYVRTVAAARRRARRRLLHESNLHRCRPC